ncbi:hypothetical protein CDAR_577421 [Caerostris darwini]|uniref:Uncharacterized protein n=1 Tax=Caerostris darwini TaxID=1538125 RepID=A0AAV4U3U1_9ARAC|nr:hypothetical protein CDAR_577421 [Caerostris darwini]
MLLQKKSPLITLRSQAHQKIHEATRDYSRFLFGFKALAQSTNTHSSQVVPSIKPTQSRRIKIPPRQDALAEEKPFNYTALAGQLFRKHFYQYSTSSVAPLRQSLANITISKESPRRGLDWIGRNLADSVQSLVGAKSNCRNAIAFFFLLAFLIT